MITHTSHDHIYEPAMAATKSLRQRPQWHVTYLPTVWPEKSGLKTSFSKENSEHLPRGIDCLWGNFCPGLVIRDFCCCNDISRPVYVWLLQLSYSCGHTLADLRTVPGAPLSFSLRWVCF